MTKIKFITNQVCCLYCHKIFIIKGKTRWHNCPQAVTARKAINNERIKACRNKVNYGRQFLKNVFDKTGWKKCKRCKALTPNRFSFCDICLSKIGSKFDLDMVQAFECGYERRV